MFSQQRQLCREEIVHGALERRLGVAAGVDPADVAGPRLERAEDGSLADDDEPAGVRRDRVERRERPVDVLVDLCVTPPLEPRL